MKRIHFSNKFLFNLIAARKYFILWTQFFSKKCSAMLINRNFSNFFTYRSILGNKVLCNLKLIYAKLFFFTVCRCCRLFASIDFCFSLFLRSFGTHYYDSLPCVARCMSCCALGVINIMNAMSRVSWFVSCFASCDMPCYDGISSTSKTLFSQCFSGAAVCLLR